MKKFICHFEIKVVPETYPTGTARVRFYNGSNALNDVQPTASKL